ncbi:ABC transporter permease [Phenylobacterium sp.]|jgi:putative ABC transport system permease protein|uniref:ABC transporter permease n=1 Tax=Phenylobacterium sp. TaxID=1871053 RepID=UPI0025ED64D5|nr:ABC transporter permease [Phenylobacterium sp.]|tara:strand:+ start:12842 stop:14152 length:1311 start_codon:yes stop_codon:yes gene_type:complete
MTLAGLSLAYLKDRALNTTLNVLLLTLSVATLVILVLFSSQLAERFDRDARGIDLVVGAKGSPLQLILSSIYQVDVPTGNIPLSTVDLLRADPTVAEVIPLALGDSFRGYRIVGTEPAYVANFGGTLIEGEMFAADYQAVIGAQVARETGAGLGQKFVGSHGLSGDGHAHEETPYEVVGILAPTGTVLDRLIVTPVGSIWAAHGFAPPPAEGAAEDHDDHAGHDYDGDGHQDHAADAHDDRADDEAAHAAHAGGDLEVTALLIKYRSSMAAVRLPNFINKQTELQAAAPAVEMTRLLSLLGVGIDAVRAFAVLLMATSGLSIFVALYSALRQREGDMAMLRVMGARPGAIFGHIVLEGVLLAAAGALLGVAVGHAVVAASAASFPQLRDMGLTAARFEPAEFVIVMAAIGMGALAALIPALKVFRVDIAKTLADTR